MSKYHPTVNESPTRARRRSRATFLALFTIVIALSPWWYEEGTVVYAQWRTLTGTYTVVRTPRLDALGDWSRAARESLRSGASSTLNGQWSASMAVPLGIGWAAVMALVFLRKSR